MLAYFVKIDVLVRDGPDSQFSSGSWAFLIGNTLAAISAIERHLGEESIFSLQEVNEYIAAAATAILQSHCPSFLIIVI